MAFAFPSTRQYSIEELASHPSVAYRAQAEEMKLVAAVRGGTRTMRESGETYLPRFEKESEKAYRARKDRSTFFNAFRKTLRAVCAHPFSKKMTVSDRVPAQIKQWLTNDCDLCGGRIDLFASNVFQDGVADGVAFILIDKLNAEAQNAAEERALQNRPYFVKVDRRNVIGWKTVVAGGREIITEVRIRETGYEQSATDPNPWEEVPFPRVRVFRPGSWELYRATQDGVWFKEDEGQLLTAGGRPLSRVPLIPFYTRRVAPLQGESPLLDLAYLNVEHWQSRSDQTEILHKARVPIPVATGFDGEDFKEFITSTHNVLITANPDAKLAFAEITGTSIEAGRRDLEDIEQRMRRVGYELLIKDKVVTATERKGDEGELQCEIAQFVQQLEDALTYAIEVMAEWEGLPIREGDDSLVSINKDFGISSRDAQEVGHLFTAMERGLVTKETGLRELQRRGVFDDNLDIKAEVEALRAEEQASLAAAFSRFGGGAEGEEGDGEGADEEEEDNAPAAGGSDDGEAGDQDLDDDELAAATANRRARGARGRRPSLPGGARTS